MGLTSFGTEARAVVIGASGGIGGAVADALRSDPAFAEATLFSRSGTGPGGEAAHRIDLEDETSIAEAAGRAGGADLIFVATGLLHDGAFQPEKSLRSIDADGLARSFAVNAVGPALIAKHFLPRAPRDRRTVFACLSARVGSIADNQVGGWYGYRASKAALNMLLKTAAIEMGRTRRRLVVLALQPGTVDTGLSKPFQGTAKTIMNPAESAAHLLQVVDRSAPDWSGGLYDWRGDRLPF